jgi:hypothetical protein
MGTIIEFPTDAATRRVDSTPRNEVATVLILPVVRIERHEVETAGGQDPEHGAAPRRGRRRRARS